MNRTLWILVAKDLRLHGGPLALVFAAPLAACAAMMHFGPDRGQGPFVGLVFNVNMVVAAFMSEWLVARERTKRTFAWLRTLPVDDRALAGSKFLMAAAVSVGLWTATSITFAPALWSPWTTGLVLQGLLLVLGALCIAARLRFNWHYAHLAGVLVFAAPLVLFVAFAGEDTARRAAVAALWNAPYSRPLAAAGLLLFHFAVVWTTVRWFARADTYRIVD